VALLALDSGIGASRMASPLPINRADLRCKFLDRVHPAEGRAQLEGFFESVVGEGGLALFLAAEPIDFAAVHVEEW
jgi:hypothetical protein